MDFYHIGMMRLEREVETLKRESQSLRNMNIIIAVALLVYVLVHG